MHETTTSRVLRLLSLLQSRRSWSGTELADRIGVSTRTVRRDIDRLRELGYRIAAERGSVGGYRLEAGSDLPPLLFTSDEAVALTIALRSAAADGVVQDMAALTVSALAKLEQVLPSTVRARVGAIATAVVAAAPVRARDLVEPEAFAVLALACRDCEIVRFDYTDASGSRSARRVEPAALVPVDRRWFLLAWDAEREDWRTFRVDRVTEVRRTHAVVPRRGVPGGDAATFVQARFALPPVLRFGATIRIDAPLPEVEARIGGFTTGLVADGDGTAWRIEAERVEILHGALAWLVWPFRIAEGEELQRFAAAFTARSAA